MNIVYSLFPVLKVKPDKLRNLPPAFAKEGGTVTAGNSSIIADGAAALVLVSAERASELGLRVCYSPDFAGPHIVMLGEGAMTSK